MALSDAVLSIADEMELESESHVKEVAFLFRSFARELRNAVKAAEGTHPFPPNASLPSPITSPDEFNRLMVEQAREEFRKTRNEKSTRMVEMPDGTMVEVPDIASTVNVLGQDYRVDGNKLIPS